MKKLNVGQSRSGIGDIWYRFKKNKPALIGFIVICIIGIFAIFADVFADYDTLCIQMTPLDRLQGPSWQHIFGTDAFGRDLFARTIHGARVSLSFGLICASLSMVGGSLIGATAAYFGGKIDNIIMRIVDVIMSIPGILLTLALITVLGLGLKNMIIAMTIGMVPGFSRIVRALVLTIVRQEYIDAARASGCSSLRIIIVHVLPNAVAMIIVYATMNIAGLIIGAASLSFIGMGVQPPRPEWGSMVADATTYMRLYPHIVLVPGLAIVVTALSFNLFGDGLADALDPRMRD